MIDYNLKTRALELAISACSKDYPPALIVEAAERFERFLMDESIQAVTSKIDDRALTDAECVPLGITRIKV